MLGSIEHHRKLMANILAVAGLGSKKDDEVIAAADKYGIAMVFTGKRHFKH